MSFADELNDIKKTETGAKFINKAGVYVLKLTGYVDSSTVKGYSGKPYMEWNFVNAEGEITNAKMYRAQDGDSDSAKEFKNKMFKEFLDNIGANWDLKGEEFLKDLIGKKIKALLREEEYIGKDKVNNNKPIIKSIVRYAWSTTEDGDIGGNQSHLKKPLDEKRTEQYKAQLDAWNEEHGTEITKHEDDADDDLPF